MGGESKPREIHSKLMKEVPRPYLKSRPAYFGKDVGLEVTLTTTGDDEDEIEARIGGAISKMERGFCP
jgi:hypothetical protein